MASPPIMCVDSATRRSKLGQAVTDAGRPASEADLKMVFEKYRVPAPSRAALTALWRRIESGGDAR
jgi:hypothetical protein